MPAPPPSRPRSGGLIPPPAPNMRPTTTLCRHNTVSSRAKRGTRFLSFLREASASARSGVFIPPVMCSGGFVPPFSSCSGRTLDRPCAKKDRALCVSSPIQVIRRPERSEGSLFDPSVLPPHPNQRHPERSEEPAFRQGMALAVPSPTQLQGALAPEAPSPFPPPII